MTAHYSCVLHNTGNDGFPALMRSRLPLDRDSSVQCVMVDVQIQPSDARKGLEPLTQKSQTRYAYHE